MSDNIMEIDTVDVMEASVLSRDDEDGETRSDVMDGQLPSSSNKPVARRPPRPPPRNVTTAPIAIGHHRAISEVTTEQISPTAGDPVRNRRVSWDDAEHPSTTFMRQESISSFATANSNCNDNDNDVLVTDNNIDHRAAPNMDPNQVLTVQEYMRLGNPLEEEAESAILQALEEQEFRAEEEGHFVSATSHLDIPQNTVHMFEEAPTAAAPAAAADENTSNINATGSFPTPAQLNNLKQMEESSRGGGQTNSTGAPSPHSQAPPPESAKPPNMFNIATKLRMMQTGASHETGSVVSGGGYLKRAESFKNKSQDTSQHNNSNNSNNRTSEGSDHDSLLQNANLLFRRQSVANLNTGAPHPPASGAQESKWNKVRMATKCTTAFQNNKKHDDPQAGGASPLDVPSGGEDGLTMDEKVEESTPAQSNTRNTNRSSSMRRKKKRGRIRKCFGGIRSIFTDFFSDPKRIRTIKTYLKRMILYMMVPMLCISAILFYAVGNPLLSPNGASYSWWLQFLFCRQALTFTISKAFEIFFVDFLSFRTRVHIKLLGPFVTLMIVQARGWPYIMTFWCVWNLILLYGSGRFANHWGFWQDVFDMFNETNNSGNTTSDSFYLRLLIAGIVAGVLTSLKRVWITTYLGKRSYEHYGPQLEEIMRKMLLISEVAHLSVEIEEASAYHDYFIDEDRIHRKNKALGGWKFKDLSESEGDEGEDDGEDASQTPSQNSTASPMTKSLKAAPQAADTDDKPPTNDETDTSAPDPIEPMAPRPAFETMSSSQKIRLLPQLGEWTEPEILTKSKTAGKATINDVLQYRQALTYMDTRHPFSDAFGPAKTRAECVESAQNTYLRLLKHTPERSILPFETLSLIAVDNVGGLEQKKTKSLVKLFRPDGKGELKLLDFVKACDSVYKELRLFRAGTANSSQIDLAFESIVNVLFFFLLGMLVLTIMELDPLALFLSLSGLLLSFAFMFGSAAAKYFEGILLIFVRRPYDIGDRIALSDVNKDTSAGGSATWYVEGVNLFTTTVRYAASNEVATLANGSLATSRIINGARSPKAVVYVYIKFSVDVSYNRIKIFKSAVDGFVKARPSEWVGMTAFRPTTIEIDRAYVEYMIALQHRNRWQDIGPILQSKADIASFSLELSKKLDMRYIAPALPVNMSLNEKTQMAFLNKAPEPIATDIPAEQPSDPTLSPTSLKRLSEIFKPEKKK